MIYRLWWFVLKPLVSAYWRVRYRGLENVRGLRGMIIASNHQSGIDPVPICLAFWRQVFWLAKVELVITKKVAWFFKSVSVIPVDRNAPKDAALDAAAECVRRGRIFGIFPEGTRAPDRRVYKGHTGVARVAHLSGGPVVPAALVGSARACPKGKRLIRPYKVEVRFGKPLYFSMEHGESQSDAYRRFTDQVMEAIASLAGHPLVRDTYSSQMRDRAEQRLAS